MHVDISGAGANRSALPGPVKVNGPLMRLGIAALCAFTALGGGCALALGMSSRNDYASPSFFAPFGGWQVDAVVAAFAAGLLAVFLVAAVTVRRTYRVLRARTAHAREVVFVALLPGLFFGGLLWAPMGSAVSWASRQTAAGRAAEAEFRQMLTTDRAHPPTLSWGRTAAEPSLAARMLHPADLGGGWYDGERPNPSEASGGVQGELLSVRSNIGRWHWTGEMWSPDNLVTESLRRFATPAAAQAYLAKFGQQPKGVPGPRLGPVTLVRVGTVLVSEDQEVTSIHRRGAAFVAGADEFFVISSNVPAADFAALVKAAVDRATTGR